MKSGGETLVACCGLDCAQCFGRKGRVADLARDLRKELRDSGYGRFAGMMAKTPHGKAYEDYDACYAVLGQMVRFRCPRACRNGGGNPACRIRQCVRSRGIAGCWDCADEAECEKLDVLEPVHGAAHRRNLSRIRSGKGGLRWYEKR